MGLAGIAYWARSAAVKRVPGARRLWQRFPLGSVHLKTEYDIWERPAYAYGVYSAALLAKALGQPSLTAIEFGVARGDGLVALERICHEIGAAFGIEITVAGFDTGQGNPKPADYRDLPYLWDEGFYAMDEAAVRSRLNGTKLVLGDVAETIDSFVREVPNPIGFISFDLDYYSSTVQAFRVFEGAAATRLPRVFCYFDDILWPERAYYNEFTGEYLAINEFNEQHPRQKIARIPHLHHMRRFPAGWNEQLFVCHDFDHPDYCINTKRSTPLAANEMAE